MRLYRAVSSIELNDIRLHQGFRDSKHQSGEKGFFFERSDAAKLIPSLSSWDRLEYSIVAIEVPDEVIGRGRVHTATREGPGVYLLASDLHQLGPAIEV